MSTTTAPPSFHLPPSDTFLCVGRVTPASVRLWWQQPPSTDTVIVTVTGPDGAVESRCAPLSPLDDPHVRTLLWPDEADTDTALDPATAYTVRVDTPERVLVGSARFVTPATGYDIDKPFAIGVTSCIQPFDDQGALDPNATALLRHLPAAFEAQNVQLGLMLGDQMYADWPPPLSLFNEDHFRSVGPADRDSLLDCSVAEVRALYAERYRRMLGITCLRQLQTLFPTYPVIDDHEIIDNFGSHPDHSTPRWAAVRQGALDAAHVWQTSRVLGAPKPDSLDYGFAYGPVAGFMMDIQSNRRAAGRDVTACEDAQLDALEAFFAQSAHPVLVLGLSVPLAHGPRALGKLAGWVLPHGNDFVDRWVFSKRCERRVIELIAAQAADHPGQLLILAGGDVHAGAISRFCWHKDARETYQLTSSAVANLEGRHIRFVSSRLPYIRPSLGRKRARLRVCKAGPGQTNPLPALNAGLIEVRPAPHGVDVRLALLTPNEEKTGVQRAFTTDWLAASPR